MESPTLVIRRISSRPDGMFGVALRRWRGEELPFALTGEDAWKGNASNVSCIPAGRYRATRFKSPKFGYEVFLLHDVPGRSLIEIHIGNTHQDVQGCIYIGASYEITHGVCGVGASKAAFAEFMQLFSEWDEIVVEIEDCWGGTTEVTH